MVSLAFIAPVAEASVGGTVRGGAVMRWLDEAAPDVLALQETKLEDVRFPAQAFADAGYHVLFSGQKTYNGVALLSKHPVSDVRRGLPGDDGDEQAHQHQRQRGGDDQRDGHGEVAAQAFDTLTENKLPVHGYLLTSP